MAAMVAKGPEVFCSEEAELLACRKAIEFAVDAGFSELVIEGDNSSTFNAENWSFIAWESGWGYSTLASKFALGTDWLY